MVCQQWFCRRSKERSAEVTLSILSSAQRKSHRKKTFIGLNMLKPKGTENGFFSVHCSLVSAQLFMCYSLLYTIKELSGQNRPFSYCQIDIQDTNLTE